MPNATISEEAWDIIKYLFRDTRRAIMKDSGVISALHFLTTEESVSTNAVPHIPPEIPPSDNRLDALNEHIKKYFPVHDVSSQGTWCSPDSMLPAVVERDEPLLIHGRIVAALNSPQTERNYRRLVFLVTVIIIHHLGHSIVAAFNPDHHGLCEDIDDFPYHACHFARERNDRSILIPDPGFIAEEAIFGGIIGVVFKEEREGGYPPRLLHADFSHIAHFIIRCRDNRTYQIRTSLHLLIEIHDSRCSPTLASEEIDSRVENMDLRPFDISHLQRVRGLRRIPERTCAFFNGDHIPVEFPGEGGEIPRRRSGVSRTPTPSDSYESRNGSPRSSQRRSRHEGRERGGPPQRVREQVPIEPRGSHVPIDSHERQESQETYTTDTTATTSTTSMGLPRDGEQTPRDSLELEREYRQSRGFDDWTDLEQHREEIPGALPSHYEGDPGAFHREPPPDEFPPNAFHDAPHNGFQDAPHDGLHASSHDEYPEQQFGFPSEEFSQRRVEFAPDPVHERPPEENAEPFPDPTEEVTVPPVIPQPTPSTRGKGKKLKRRGG